MSGTANSIALALEERATALEREIQQRLHGFLGGFMRAYLPQTWTLVGENDAASLTVDREGRVLVTPGRASAPDVTVEGSEAILLSALRARPDGKARRPEVSVTTRTAKGKAAFDFLRGRFGL